MKKKANYEKINTFLARDITIDGGTLNASEPVRIDGTYIGNIICQESLCVGETGQVKGNIQASNILVGGKVEGNLESEHETHLSNTCTVVGDIQCGSFIVDEGATFDGTCKMVGNPPKSKLKKAAVKEKKD